MGGALDPTAMLTAFQQVGRMVLPTLAVLAFLAGTFFVGRAGWLMVTGRDGRGPQDDVPIGGVVANILAGGALVAFARTMTNMRDTLGGAGTEVRAGLAYMASSAGNAPIITLAVAVAATWIAALGGVAIFRGVLLWRSMGQGDNRGGDGDLFWRGLWHLLAGGLCLNIGLGNVGF